jgi:hypothetical protein
MEQDAALTVCLQSSELIFQEDSLFSIKNRGSLVHIHEMVLVFWSVLVFGDLIGALLSDIDFKQRLSPRSAPKSL